MARTQKTSGKPKHVVALKHDKASRKNIPPAELQSTAELLEAKAPQPPARYPRTRPLPAGEKRQRDADLDPQIIWSGARITLTQAQREQLQATGEVEIGDAQLVWRGKDEQDWSDLVVQPPQLFVQEKLHPKAIIDDLKRHRGAQKSELDEPPDLFADFNGLNPEARTDFYQHDAHWTNRMILGDSLQVMASLAEREALRGKVQCIYFDPPYGIKFNSNWQVSTQSREVQDGKQTDISREPEQVKAFRDTWKDAIHSYLAYLRDRLTVARELLTESGSIFVQIGDENVHRVRAVMDEVFGATSFVVTIVAKKKGSQISNTLDPVNDYILWYGKASKSSGGIKARALTESIADGETASIYPMVDIGEGMRMSLAELSKTDEVDYGSDINSLRRRYPHARLFSLNPLKSGGYRKNQSIDLKMWGRTFPVGAGNCWKHTVQASDGSVSGMERLRRADCLYPLQKDVRFIRYAPSPAFTRLSNWWDGLGGAASPIYVVQTNVELVKRCILMVTDPGDLVLDPTCGSGTTAFAAEQWGRRWITIDTSRVSLALARTRMMSAVYPYYVLADSPEGRRKEQELSGSPQSLSSCMGDIRQGFVYQRAKWNTSGSIANNAEIDILYERWQTVLEPLRATLNATYGGEPFEDWEIPRQAGANWPPAAKKTHAQWWEGRLGRQREIDASIAKAADVELLYDRPYTDNTRVRVAGPFTVESLSPHRIVPADAAALYDKADELPERAPRTNGGGEMTDFAAMILDNLRAAGVHSTEKRDAIRFTSLTPWPGISGICAEGRFLEGETERRAAIFLGPEFGTLSRSDLVAAAREATEARFDVLIACAFAYDAHASDFTRLGPLPILKAKMNPDLHMAGELKATGKGNLFVVFGEPDIDIETVEGDALRVRVKGIDVFDPNTGEIRSDDTDGIAAWFIDTDYDMESFFVRHAYFLGANDPYKSLKSALRAEMDEACWLALYSDVSMPFLRPARGRIAVKVINHFGDEVFKVFRV